jgi:hypothetical protein
MSVIQLKRGTAARWIEVNTLLAEGELGLEKDTGMFKIGDGITLWSGLDYAGIMGPEGPSGYTPTKGVDYFDGEKGDKGDKGDTGETPDISGKVDKVSGSSLVLDSEIAKIHAAGIDNQDLSDLVSTSDARLSDARTPLTHNHDGSYEPANANIQTHVTAAHAPSNAQKNSDITKAEIEAKLTGEISSHTHAGGGGGLGYAINVQALTSSPTDAQTVYFGTLPKAPITTANVSKVYIRKAGTIKIAEIYCYSGTAGTNEAWSLYIRKNNTTDTLIATLSVATSERVFSNASLSIAVSVGDYIEIKGIQPTWATNPLTTIYGGYVYIE